MIGGSGFGVWDMVERTSFDRSSILMGGSAPSTPPSLPLAMLAVQLMLGCDDAGLAAMEE